ncbi:N-terminal Xaa-Pro-Lys N-methyltransferase 1 [Striga asiatica]|uniref:N-terminal Xaa-Pro-Lys N-methyltransferase 1 n=1 Tax=Striga asiatica TaxID=4170 RepID=A0A5A7QAH8_STRAF|nr:N-terminal Xaa-Pro-Lys N-methyltransferase 1 [Striga asiatica]
MILQASFGHELVHQKPVVTLQTIANKPDPGLEAVRVCSSIHPLKTYPNPPSPRRLSDLKFLVALRNSLKVKALTCGDDRISASDLGVGKLSALLLPLYEGIVMLDGTDELLFLLGYRDAPNNEERQNKYIKSNEMKSTGQQLVKHVSNKKV